jgi:hypothetical protein
VLGDGEYGRQMQRDEGGEDAGGDSH